jgi:hypothetical protein
VFNNLRWKTTRRPHDDPPLTVALEDVQNGHSSRWVKNSSHSGVRGAEPRRGSTRLVLISTTNGSGSGVSIRTVVVTMELWTYRLVLTLGFLGSGPFVSGRFPRWPRTETYHSPSRRQMFNPVQILHNEIRGRVHTAGPGRAAGTAVG